MNLERENWKAISKYDSFYILLEQRGKVCKQLPIGWQKTKRRTALYTSSNKLKRQKNIYWSIVIIISLWRTKQVLKTGPAATQAILLSEMTLSLFGFVTCLQNHIFFTDKCDTPLSTSECIWLRLNRQSFYHYQKQQLVPTDGYWFRTIGKLIRSISHDRVAYRYLDAFPKLNGGF